MNKTREASSFLINLAITDILKSVLGLPLVVVSNFYGYWIFEQIGISTFRAFRTLISIKCYVCS